MAKTASASNNMPGLRPKRIRVHVGTARQPVDRHSHVAMAHPHRAVTVRRVVRVRRPVPVASPLTVQSRPARRGKRASYQHIRIPEPVEGLSFFFTIAK